MPLTQSKFCSSLSSSLEQRGSIKDAKGRSPADCAVSPDVQTRVTRICPAPTQKLQAAKIALP
jgi:hypothetical protein